MSNVSEKQSSSLLLALKQMGAEDEWLCHEGEQDSEEIREIYESSWSRDKAGSRAVAPLKRQTALSA